VFLKLVCVYVYQPEVTLEESYFYAISAALFGFYLVNFKIIFKRFGKLKQYFQKLLNMIEQIILLDLLQFIHMSYK